MYSIAQVMDVVYKDEWKYVLMAFITYGFGFAQYITSMVQQIRDKECPFYFWQHCWYFGHDIVFSCLFYQWFHVIDFWLFKVLCIGCMMFVLIEIVSLYYSVKYERQIIWGKYTHSEVSEKQGWIRGFTGFAIGALLFVTIRLAIGDVMCLVLMMSTNATLAIITSFKLEETNHRQKGTIALAWFIILGTAFTFAPPGIGFFATSIAALNHPWFYILGAMCELLSIRYLVVALKLPKLGKAIEATKEPAIN